MEALLHGRLSLPLALQGRGPAPAHRCEGGRPHLRLFSRGHERLLESFYGERAAARYVPVLRSLAGVLEEKVSPRSLALDQGKAEIGDLRRVLFDQGVVGMPHSADSGGMGFPFGVYAIAMELAGAADASTAMSVGIHGTVADALALFGSPGQRSRLLPELLSGRRLAAFALTEPSSGSDARSMRTKATREGEGYVLDGSKAFITNAGEADVYLVFAALEGGHAAFLVEAGTPGLAVGRPLGEKLGMRGTLTAEVTLTGCRVGRDALVGREGDGFENAKAVLDSSRVVMGMVCVGIARAAYEGALGYSKERRLFGASLSDLQLTRQKVADAATDISASRLLCVHASRLRERGLPFSSEAAQAKVFATEAATRTCDSAIQLLGGYGYTSEDVHRRWRDARLLTIGEGASEVLRLLIASKELEAQR